jgi:hypothetical protein
VAAAAASALQMWIAMPGTVPGLQDKRCVASYSKYQQLVDMTVFFHVTSAMLTKVGQQGITAVCQHL